MNDLDKLRVLIPHWIEHNEEHAAEFERWAQAVTPVRPEIRAAAEAVRNANHALSSALERLGGPLELGQIHHHQDHK
jgi:hypothetical protein